MDIIRARAKSARVNSNIFRPDFFRIYNTQERKNFEELLSSDETILVHDEIVGQLKELIKSLNPSVKIKEDQYPALIEKHLAGKNIDQYGVWVYYPWSKKMVHLLDEEEFVEIRTNRNRYKITREEQAILKEKKIGIVGLSVGQSIALTLAMERTCGELRLADFDTAELSNLNRIRTGVENLGINKTIIAAREIAEIDPFIKISIFNDGLTSDNIDSFFEGDGKIDLLVEVCDGLDIKIVSRFKARELRIPVVMDTNDRGMLDVERFDLEPERPIMHGLAEGLDPENIKDLSNEEKIPYILKMVGAESISTRLKASMIEVEQSINTWPQLASSVTLGGAVTTDVCRRIFLDQYHESGRYYIDIENLVGNKKEKKPRQIPVDYLPPSAIEKAELIRIAEQYSSTEFSEEILKEEIEQLVNAAVLAPSGGNCQPWKFLYKQSKLFVFHDLNVSYSFLDFKSLGAYVALGAAIENIDHKASELNLGCHVDYSPFEKENPLVAVVHFTRKPNLVPSPLSPVISLRLTNRNIAQREILDQQFYSDLKKSIADYNGAALDIVDDWTQMQELGDILATTEKLVLIHPRGHFDSFKKELRWSEEENQEKQDGIDVATLGISKGEVAALRIANDSEAIGFVRDTIVGGNAFKKMAQKAVAASSALGIITMPSFSEKGFLLGGRAVERVWLEANMQGVSYQPISQFTFLLARLMHGNGEGFNDFYRNEFTSLKKRFFNLLPHLENRQPVFIFRLCKAEAPQIKALRKPLDSVFIY
ncbi:MAG TPA: Rv1355c family protein [Flavipsychrobacter sp.]|nr:Rv1355c family protein [Flavipsychrobacter sp.]